jgi:hypothetical protein
MTYNFFVSCSRHDNEQRRRRPYVTTANVMALTRGEESFSTVHGLAFCSKRCLAFNASS